MNYNGFADNLICRKAVCQKDRKGISAAYEKRRKITCVIGVRALTWIIMSTCAREGVGFGSVTACACVNMKSEDRAFAFAHRGREPVYLCGDNTTYVCLEE